MGIVLVVFVMVTFGLLGSAQLVSRYLHRDELKVRRRIVQDFGKGLDDDSKPALYHDLGRLDLDAATAQTNGEAHHESFVGVSGPRQRIEMLIAQARAALTRQHIYLILMVAGIGMGLGVSGIWLGGISIGLVAALAGGAAPIVIADVKQGPQGEILESASKRV